MLHTSWSKLLLGVWFLVKAHPAHVMSVTWGFCSFPCELQVFYSAKQIAPLWAFEVRQPGVCSSIAPRELHEAAQEGLGIGLVSFPYIPQSVIAQPVDCRAAFEVEQIYQEKEVNTLKVFSKRVHIISQSLLILLIQIISISQFIRNRLLNKSKICTSSDLVTAHTLAST